MPKSAPFLYLAAILPMILEGWILAGRLDTAISTAQEAVFAIRGEGDTRAEMVVAIGLAEGYALQGRWDQAAEHAEKAYEAALAQDARGVLLRAMRLKANVALGRGEHEEALAWAEKGQRLAGQTHMRVQAALLVLAV